MAEYLRFGVSDQSSILVEVTPDEVRPPPGVVKAGVGERVQTTVVQAQALFDGALLNVLRHTAQALSDAVKDLPEGLSQAELTFGLRASGEAGNFAVAKAGGEVNYSVKLVWERPPKTA